MRKQFLPIQTIENNGSPSSSVTSARASFKLPIGKMVYGFYINGTVKRTDVPPQLSDIVSYLEILRNAKILRAFSPAQVDALNSFDAEQLRVDLEGATGQVLGLLTLPTIAGTATGVAVGDIISPGGGTLANIPGASKALLMVTTVSSGNPTAVRIVNPGQYAVAPSTSATAYTIVTGSGSIGSGTLACVLVPQTSLAQSQYILQTANSANVMLSLFAAPCPMTGDTVTFKLGVYFADPSFTSTAQANMFALPTRWPVCPVDGRGLVRKEDGRQELQSLVVNIDIPYNASASLHNLRATVVCTDELGVLIDKNGNLGVALDLNQPNRITPLGGSFDASSAQPFQKTLKWVRGTIPYNGTTEFEHELAKEGNLQQIALFGTDAISQVRLIVDGVEERGQLTKADVDKFNKDSGMSPLAQDPFRFDHVFAFEHFTDGLDFSRIGSAKLMITMQTANAATKSLTYIKKTYDDPQ